MAQQGYYPGVIKVDEGSFEASVSVSGVFPTPPVSLSRLPDGRSAKHDSAGVERYL